MVAPVVSGATLKAVAHSERATNMIIVRHPFDRSDGRELSVNLTFNLISYSPQNRLRLQGQAGKMSQ